MLTRSLAGGRREGILSSCGTLVGGFAHVIAAGLGLSSLLATSAIAYQAVRWAGAAYLVYLGIRMIRRAASDSEDVNVVQAGIAPSSGNAFAQGIVTEVLNPKTALFFLSFIPQFVDAHAGAVLPQFLLLGAITVALNSAVDIVIACFAGPIGQRLLASRRGRRYQQRITGAGMIGLGAYVATREA